MNPNLESILGKLESYSLLRLGSIGLCKESECKIVSDLELANPSGMISKVIFDGDKQLTRTFLFVSQINLNAIALYEVEYDHR